MKFEELKNMNADDLTKKELEARIELMKLKSQVATGTNPKNPHQIKELKQLLARVKTLQKTRK